MNARRYGWIPDFPDRRDIRFKPPLKGLPQTRVDWTGHLPPCYDQGDLGSCTANALAGAWQFLEAVKPEPVVMPSRLFIYYNERVIEHSVSSDSGAMIRDGIKTMHKQGVCSELAWPYNIAKFASKPAAPCYSAARKWELLNYQRVNNSTLNNLLAAVEIGPVVGGFSVYESFETKQVESTGIVPMPGPNEVLLGGHAILVVGFDTFKKRFRVRNSWGTKWGQDGYFTVPFEYFTNSDLADDFWLCQSIA